MKIMNFEVFTGRLASLDFNHKKVINTLNAHSYIVAKNDEIFNRALHDSDIILPDGSGIVLAAKNIHKKHINKIAGADIHEFILEKMNKRSGKVFYMGSSETNLSKIKKKINREYPNIIVDSYSPPFKTTFTEYENSIIIKKINRFKPDVLFVGMTAPKQEKWLYENKNNLEYKVACCIGAVFDFYAETIQRPSIFWRNLVGESIPRFFQNPKKMWKRNFISIPLFIIDMLMYKFKFKK